MSNVQLSGYGVNGAITNTCTDAPSPCMDSICRQQRWSIKANATDRIENNRASLVLRTSCCLHTHQELQSLVSSGQSRESCVTDTVQLMQISQKVHTTQWWIVRQKCLCSDFRMHWSISTFFWSRNHNQSPYKVLIADDWVYCERGSRGLLTQHFHIWLDLRNIYIQLLLYTLNRHRACNMTVLCNHHCCAICHVGFAWGGRLRCLKSYHQ